MCVVEWKINFILQSPQKRNVESCRLAWLPIYLATSSLILHILSVLTCRHLSDNAERQEVRTECEHDGDTSRSIADTTNRQSLAQPGTIHDTARGEFFSFSAATIDDDDDLTQQTIFQLDC